MDMAAYAGYWISRFWKKVISDHPPRHPAGTIRADYPAGAFHIEFLIESKSVQLSYFADKLVSKRKPRNNA